MSDIISSAISGRLDRGLSLGGGKEFAKPLVGDPRFGGRGGFAALFDKLAALATATKFLVAPPANGLPLAKGLAPCLHKTRSWP